MGFFVSSFQLQYFFTRAKINCLFITCFVFPFQVCFATFDPPESGDGVGHFCLVVLNIKDRRFELLDSMRGRNDPDAIRVMHVMSRNIKKLWREAADERGRSFNPYSIDEWPLQYINSSQQRNT